MDNQLSRELFALLHGTGTTVVTAESCTAGAVATAIVATPGASEYFLGGIVAYTNAVKTALLHVPTELLDIFTAVSQPVAEAMARGARQVFHADYSVAVTGLAGPGGGTEAIPVGTIWLAVDSDHGVRSVRLTGDDGRAENVQRAVTRALELLIEVVKD